MVVEISFVIFTLLDTNRECGQLCDFGGIVERNPGMESPWNVANIDFPEL